MKTFKKLLIAVMVIAIMITATVSLASCDDGEYLKVATNAEFTPFEYLENGKIVGFDIEYIDAIAKEMGYKGAKIENMDFDSIIPSISSGQCDVGIAGMTVTEKRKQSVDFSDTYFDASQTIIFKDETKFGNLTTEDAIWEALKGKKIAVAKSFSGDIMISDAIDGYTDEDGNPVKGQLEGSGASVTRFKTGGLAVQELANGNVDVVVIDKAPAQALAKKFADKGIKASNVDMGTEQYAIATKKGNAELIEKINKAMKTLEENGTFAKITAKYFE